MFSFTSYLVALLGLVSLAIGSPMDRVVEKNDMPRCGFKPTEEQMQLVQQLLLEERRLSTSQILEKRDTVSVNVYFNVIARNQTLEGGYLKAGHLKAQLAVLNKLYKPHDFQFYWKDSFYTINETWAAGQQHGEMRRTLHKGSYADLNVYFCPSMEEPLPGLEGWSAYPFFDGSPGSDPVLNDGVVVHSSTVTNGLLGETGGLLAHQIGHWMGLLHTFQTGCEGIGDGIDDTPYQKGPTESCPDLEGRPWPNTCPNKPGRDPIHNMMDAWVNGCRWEFTRGQAERMHVMWNQYRKGK